jgi:hypothetical protein
MKDYIKNVPVSACATSRIHMRTCTFSISSAPQVNPAKYTNIEVQQLGGIRKFNLKNLV